MSDHKTIIQERVLPAIDRAEGLIDGGQDPTGAFLDAIQWMQEGAWMRRETLTDTSKLPRIEQVTEDLNLLELGLSLLKGDGFIPEPLASSFFEVMHRWSKSETLKND